MKKKIGVIGASGHIGNNICRYLVEKGYGVKALIHQRANSLDDLNVEIEKGDILKPLSLANFLRDVNVVIHAAGKIPIAGDPDGSVQKTNVVGTQNVVNACLDSSVERLVYISSIHALKQDPLAELDESRAFVGEEAFPHDMSKSIAEQAVLQGILQGLDAVIITPTATIGPYDFQPSLMGQALIALYNRKVPALVSGGFDWVDVRDIAKTVVASIEKGKTGDRYIIAGVWRTVRELAEVVQAVTGKPAPKFTTPHWLAKMGVPIAKAYSAITHTPTLYTNETLDVLLRCSRNINSSKARSVLGYYPRPMEETMKDTFAWFKETGLID